MGRGRSPRPLRGVAFRTNGDEVSLKQSRSRRGTIAAIASLDAARLAQAAASAILSVLALEGDTDADLAEQTLEQVQECWFGVNVTGRVERYAA